MPLTITIVPSACFNAAFQRGLVSRRGRCMTLYRRAGLGWQRRTSHSDFAETWVGARRVPKAVRALGDRLPPTSQISVEFDNITRTAIERESWRCA